MGEGGSIMIFLLRLVLFRRTHEHKDDLWLLDTESWSWIEVEPYGVGPNPRRRQALIKAGNRIFLFGGTSPYSGPPLYFTPEQLALLPQQEEDSTSKLMDHNDLFVLDLAPSLKTLTIMAIKKNKLSTEVSNKHIHPTTPNNPLPISGPAYNSS